MPDFETMTGDETATFKSFDWFPPNSWARVPLMRAVAVYVFFRMSAIIALQSRISGAESRLQGFRFDAPIEGGHFVLAKKRGTE